MMRAGRLLAVAAAAVLVGQYAMAGEIENAYTVVSEHCDIPVKKVREDLTEVCSEGMHKKSDQEMHACLMSTAQMLFNTCKKDISDYVPLDDEDDE